MIFCNISVRPGDHAPFLETHGNSVRLGRSDGFLPSDLTDTVLVPIVKEKTGDIYDKGNYRPIALASVVSKVFEMSLLVKLEKYLYSSDYQFGFKPKHSTDLCIYTLEEVI